MQAAVAQRINMVNGQVKPNGVTDLRLLTVMSEVPRELFVPHVSKGYACRDEALHLPHGRMVLEPVLQARLIQAAMPAGGDHVLDIGGGMGYSAAVLSRLAGHVYMLELEEDFLHHADENFLHLGYENITCLQGDLNYGAPKQGPYQVVLINGAVPSVPDSLLAQLAPGGRLVAVVQSPGMPIGQAWLYQRLGSGPSSGRPLFDAVAAYLPGFTPQNGFTF
ncbi:MAG: protein-L-isoaspartate O-methyltransferase [Alphaproteobacteria bacterium]|nr:protein-L-isoaspartate O-methyltransferase [Alphaproteobacteria bacterium]